MPRGIFQSACLITESKYLWIRPFLVEGRFRGFILEDYETAKQVLIEEIDKKINKKKRGRPRKFASKVG